MTFTQLGYSLQKISDSATWREYLRINPKAKLSFRHYEGRLVFLLVNPISKGFDRTFESASDVVAFAHAELSTAQYVDDIGKIMDIPRALAKVLRFPVQNPCSGCGRQCANDELSECTRCGARYCKNPACWTCQCDREAKEIVERGIGYDEVLSVPEN